jgi:hypothetical protein
VPSVSVTNAIKLDDLLWTEYQIMIAVAMETASTSETSVILNQTTRHSSPENSHIHAVFCPQHISI